MIFANYGYKEFHNGNKDSWPIQPPSIESWCEMVKDNREYCKTPTIRKRIKLNQVQLKLQDLPSFHWHWSYRPYNSTDESFLGKFFTAGFVAIGYNKTPNPIDNWHGCSKYSPDVLLKRDDKILVLSLCGMFAKYNKIYDELFSQCAVRYILMRDRDQVVYEDWTGNLPHPEVLDSFLTN